MLMQIEGVKIKRITCKYKLYYFFKIFLTLGYGKQRSSIP
jgi:hypothetical protein